MKGEKVKVKIFPFHPMMKLLHVRAEQILNCSFSRWYPAFRAVTLKSAIVPLSDDFVDYLNADGLFLPLDQ